MWAFYLDNLSPGNITNMPSVKSNDIFLNILIVLSFSPIKNRVYVIVWGKGWVRSGLKQYKYMGKVRERQ